MTVPPPQENQQVQPTGGPFIIYEDELMLAPELITPAGEPTGIYMVPGRPPSTEEVMGRLIERDRVATRIQRREEEQQRQLQVMRHNQAVLDAAREARNRQRQMQVIRRNQAALHAARVARNPNLREIYYATG